MTVGVTFALPYLDNSPFHARRRTTVIAASLLVVRLYGTVCQLHFDWTCHCLYFVGGWKHSSWQKLQTVTVDLALLLHFSNSRHINVSNNNNNIGQNSNNTRKKQRRMRPAVLEAKCPFTAKVNERCLLVVRLGASVHWTTRTPGFYMTDDKWRSVFCCHYLLNALHRL